MKSKKIEWQSTIGVYLLDVGMITIALKTLAEISNPNLINLYRWANILGFWSILAGFIFYFYIPFKTSFKMEDSMEVNYKRLIFKIDRLICKNITLTVIFVIMAFLSFYQFVKS